MTPSNHALAPRYDIYFGIHKGIRALMSNTLLAVGRMDSEDENETAGVLERVRVLLEFCQAHLDHENRFVHTAMEARRPGSSGATGADHGEHEHAILALMTAERARFLAGMRNAMPAPDFAHVLGFVHTILDDDDRRTLDRDLATPVAA